MLGNLRHEGYSNGMQDFLGGTSWEAMTWWDFLTWGGDYGQTYENITGKPKNQLPEKICF